MSKFTRIPENTFKEIVINAGLLATNSTPRPPRSRSPS